jgi:hypothetical protein
VERRGEETRGKKGSDQGNDKKSQKETEEKRWVEK